MLATLRRVLLAAAVAATFVAPVAASAGEGGSAPPKVADFVSLGDFTVNVPANGRRREYLVLSVTVETTPGSGVGVKDVEPRLQDAVLRQLIAMSSQGVLKPEQTDPMALKDALFDTISKLRLDGVKDVLITRILYS